MRNVEKYQKLDVNCESITDLLKSLGYFVRTFKAAYLEAASKNLSTLEAGDDQAFIEAVVQEILERRPQAAKSVGMLDEYREIVRDLTIELHCHTNKKQVLQTALDALSPNAGRERKLGTLEERVGRAFRRLDRRTRAIIAIRDEIMAVDGITRCRFAENLGMGRVNIEAALGNDPSMKVALEAWRMACALQEAEQSGR